jgi:hypothetical protein
MTTLLQKTRFLALALALPLGAFAADPTLLQMVMPDAQVVAGLQVDSAKSSLFGQYVLGHFSVNDTKLSDFTSETGFDPRRDVTEIVVGSNWMQNSADNRWIVAAHGTFNVTKISTAVQANGGTPGLYQGLTLLTFSAGSKSQDTAIAFLDPSTALLGDLTSVKAAIDRKKANLGTDVAVLTKAQTASSGKDFWFVTLVPLSNFSSSIPVFGGSNGAAAGNLFAAINQASGGIRFGDTITITAEAVTRSDKDAQALVDVLKFLAGLVQLNRQSNPTAGQVATLLDTMQATASGNVTNVSLAILEGQLEQLLNGLHAQPKAAAARAN